MKYRNELPSQEMLLYLFEYKDGKLFNKTNSKQRKKGSEVGYINAYGYVVCKINSCSYYVHRLMWQMFFGSLNGKDIDHINGNKSDNRMENLRLVTKKENNRNLRKAKINSKTSLIRACFHKKSGKFIAQIQNNGKYEYIGLFETAKEAHEAYLNRKREIHETCTI